jgi:hypothetical protein
MLAGFEEDDEKSMSDASGEVLLGISIHVWMLAKI